MKRMPAPARRQHKSTGVDVVASMNASYARIDKNGNLRIRRLNSGVNNIVASPEAIEAIGAGVWLGDTVRRKGALATIALAYRTTGKPNCKTTRKVLSACNQVPGLVFRDPIRIAGQKTILVPIKSGDVDALGRELKKSDYLQPMNGSPFRAWLAEGIIPREATGSTSHELAIPCELDEYKKSEADRVKYRPPQSFYTAGSDVSPKRMDYTAGRNQPKASYGIDSRYTVNELDHSDARNQPLGAKPGDEPVKVKRLRAPDLAHTEH